MKKNQILGLTAIAMTCLAPKTVLSQGWVGANASQLYPSSTNVWVGIGTTAPAAQLHTTGTLLFQNIANNNTLTRLMVTDANGNVRWRDVSTVIPVPPPTWGLTGNAITSREFIGTTNNMPLIFKSNGIQVGSLSTGSNSMIGANAGVNMTSGTYNSFFGMSTGNRNTTGIWNSFMGAYAGFNNTGGSYNSFFGLQAGFLNTTGNSNSFIGTNSGFYNTTGSNNNFFGSHSGYANTTGSNNNFWGFQAGRYNTTGYQNNFLGMNSGFSNTTGSNNVFLGQQTGASNTTGNTNTFVGNIAGSANTTQSENTYIGYNTGNVANTNGNQNTFVGTNAGSTAAVSASTAIGYNATVARNNALILGNPNDFNLTVGIGSSMPWVNYKLHVIGNVLGNSFWVPSDQRFKQNIQTIENPISIINGLNGKTYQMRTKEFSDRHFEEGRTYGFIAQELQKVMPEAVKENKEGFLTVNYDLLIPVLTEGIKTQQKTIENLQAQLDEIKKMLKNNSDSKASSSNVTVTESKTFEIVKLEQNRPNPTTSTTIIAYEMPKTMNQGSLIISDLTGKMIQNIPLESNQADITVDVSNMADGIYVYSLVVKGEILASKKMMVQK